MSTYKRWLRQLQEARAGQPSENKAVRTIALNATCSAAMVGLLAGALIVGIADPRGLLLWVCTASAIVSGFGMAYLVLGVYRFFGFRPIAMLADALEGAGKGFLLGMSLTCAANLALLFVLPPHVPGVYALCPLLLIPIGAVAFPFFRARSGMELDRQTEGQASESQTDKEN
ncbi:MAG: hypothetical protein MUC43_09770 [Pirellula sp.]|jgi:hypothetical protein|nr:hypothetical protein [Pirellula sp.]